RMLATSASRPAILSETMRRGRVGKDSVNRNCPAPLSQLNGRCPPLIGAPPVIPSPAQDGEASPTGLSPESGGRLASHGCHLVRLTRTHFPKFVLHRRGIFRELRKVMGNGGLFRRSPI